MAYANKIIRNPQVGQDIRFLQTGKQTRGRLLEMEAIYHTTSKEPVPHYHPYQEEDFTIVSGELTTRVNEKINVLKAGDTLHIPAGTVHSMWNSTGGKTVVNWKVVPALGTEYFLETACGLATEGKVNREGMPPLLQVVLMASRFSKEFRLAKPPYLVQTVVFFLLLPFAYIAGYRPTYARYLDEHAPESHQA